MILINPKVQKLGRIGPFVPMYPPIGIGSLAAYFISQGKQVKILDENIIPVNYDLLDNCVKDASLPYIFGISCLTAGIGRAYQLAKMLKSRYPDSKIIFGGIHPTVLPEEVLKSGYVDIVVRREGEEILDSLYTLIKNRKDYLTVNGISFLNNRTIVHNPDAPLPLLDSLPQFPYHLFENHSDRYNFGFIASSRGCPYNCIFCSQRAISGRMYRYFSPEKVMELLNILINKYKQKFITFIDDDFVANKERTKKLCTLIYENKFNQKAKFDCQTRGDSLTPEILEYLKMAGFRTINIGIETASERLMKLLNKRETVQDNIYAVKLAKKFGFQVSATFILGLPTETKEERWQAYKLAKELDLNYVRFNNATPYPGTELYEIAKRENRLNPGENWENLNACGTLVEDPFNESPLAYVPTTTSEKELKKDILKANLFFSLRPKRVIRLLVERAGPVGWFLLPKNWYINPKELYHLFLFGMNIFLSFLRTLLK